MRRRGEKVERAFAHLYETGGMRRTHLRHHQNILKRLLIHVGAFNLSLVLRALAGFGKPRTLQAARQALRTAVSAFLTASRSVMERFRTAYDAIPLNPSSAIRDWEKTDTLGRNSFARMRVAQIPAEIRRIFGEFERVCSETAARYIELPSLTALLALYEFFIGSRTTAEQSGAMAYAALVIVASVGIIVFFIALLYEKGFRQLIHNMENEEPDWVHSKNVFAFLRHLVTESVGGLLLLAVPCIGVIAAIMRVLLTGM